MFILSKTRDEATSAREVRRLRAGVQVPDSPTLGWAHATAPRFHRLRSQAGPRRPGRVRWKESSCLHGGLIQGQRQG